MKTSVTIVKETPDTWTLTIACNLNTEYEHVTKKVFNKLIHALHWASTLQLHVDNSDQLPINQYYKVA